MKQYITLITLVALVFSGRIYNGDLVVDYANAGKMTQLSFSFMLTNTISNDDYLKVVMPFPFHSSLVPAVPANEGLSTPSLLLVTYQTINSFTSSINPGVFNTFILTQTIDSSNYYIRFYDSTNLNIIPIQNNTWYYLTFQILDLNALQYQMANSILQIQLSTVSSVWANSIVYDDNLAFQYFQLMSNPLNTISLAVVLTNYTGNNGYLLTQASYNMYLDVNLSIASYEFGQNLVLKFLLTDNRFLWNTLSSCSSAAKITSPTINSINNSLYTCGYSQNNIFYVNISPQALIIQTAFRFSVGIINPPIVITNVGIQVRAMKQYDSTILGYGTLSNVLNTNSIYTTYHQIFLGWGLRPDALLPFPVNIYRGNNPTPTYFPYNSLSIKFSISQTTSSNLQLKVIVAIPSQTNAFVLQNAFSHNLPAAINKIVVCQTQYVNSTTNRAIGCTGVGQLLMGTIYQIGWKMFFPYDNYMSSINCTNFGKVTIYSMQTINTTDNAFILGRGDDFLSYLKGLSSVYVIGRNISYINYMQTFFNLNLIVRSRDFQQFLTTPQSIFPTNRPTSYPNKLYGYDDVYVITQNLAFLNYIGLFSDIYIAARLKGLASDILKAYDNNPLVSQSIPKNTLAITSVNSQDWTDYIINANSLVSSNNGTLSPTSPGISNSGNNLLFSLKAPYSSITTNSISSGTSLINYSGLMIMMNPGITINSGANLTCIHSGVSNNNTNIGGYTMNSSTAYNKYTYIWLTSLKSDGISMIFTNPASKTNFAFSPVMINSVPSIYSGDANIMDFYMAAADGINGPLNKIIYNSYFLINGFAQTGTVNNSISLSFVNYLSNVNPLDGSTVPTLLKIQGSFSNSAISTVAVFFNDLTPFYRNFYTNQIFCYGSDAAINGICNYKAGAKALADVNNYNTMSRIQFPIKNPTSSFTVYIPIVVPGTSLISYTYTYLAGYTTVSNSPILSTISNMLQSSYINKVVPIGGIYGPSFSSNQVGSIVSNLQILGNYTGGALTVNTPTVSNSNGACFTFFTKWNIFQSSTILGWSTFGTCSLISYLYYNTNYQAYISSGTSFLSYYYNMSGVICSFDNASSITSASSAYFNLSSASLPYTWGTVVPGYGAHSTNTGQLMQINSINSPYQYMTPINVSITPPIIGMSMKNSIVAWVIPLPVLISQSILITITSTINLPFNVSGTCVIYSNSSSGIVKLLPISCNFLASFVQLNYTLTINSNLFSSGDTLLIYHYGITTPASGSNVTVALYCYSLASSTANTVTSNQLIFQNASFSINWNQTGYIGASNLLLSSFKQMILNGGVVSPFSLTFSLVNKGLYNTQRVRINLGQFASENTGNSLNPTCTVYTYSTTNQQIYSHDFGAVDTSQGLSQLELWPKYHLFGNNLTYTLYCNNFITTSSTSPTGISAIIANTSADLSGDLISSSNISINSLTSLSLLSQGSVSKNYITPSSFMEMYFKFISIGIDYNTILYIGFPYYYSNGLGPVISCYVENIEIYCSVSNRVITIKYIGVYESGSNFTVNVVGVSQPVNYNSGTFYYIFDFNNDLTSVNCAGLFADTVSSTILQIQNFPVIRVTEFTSSSNYIRDTGVTLTFQFYLDSKLNPISSGQKLIVSFPPIYSDILRFVSPSCSLTLQVNTLKNYVNSCKVRGTRIIIPITNTIILGATYILSLSGLINPTAMSQYYYKYEISISDSSETYIILKSFSTICNYVMTLFQNNPSLVYLNYYDVNNNQINTVYTYASVQSNPVYISSSTPVAVSIINRNINFASNSSTLLSNPAIITYLAGSNPTPITFSALTSGVQYIYFIKSGDGAYYSNLPPLTIITDLNFYQQISFINSAFALPVANVGTEYTIIVTLPTSLYPMVNVTMNVTIPINNGISLKVVPTTVTFYQSQPSASILLTIDDSMKWTVGKTTNIIITPLSTYFGTATLTLTAVASGNSMSATLVPISNSLQENYFTFNVSCADFGYFYYHIERTFTYNTTACTLDSTQIKKYALASSINGLRIKQTYFDCEDQFGILNVETINTNLLLIINNLLTTTAYKITGFCENQMNVGSSTVSATFNTVTNGGVITEMTFSFASILSVSQKIKVVCYLALYFNIDYKKVSTYDGYYCSQLLSRRLLQLQKQYPALLKPKRLLTATNFSNLIVYYGINNRESSDSSNTAILAASSQINLLNSINANIMGIPTLYNYTTSANAFIGTQDFVSSKNIFVDIGPTYVYIYGMTLPNNGLIYVIIGDTTLWSRGPIISQIKVGSGPNGLATVAYQVLAYRTADPMSGYFGFTKLPTGKFKLYIAASDENPFDTANFGGILTYNIINEMASFEWKTMYSVLLILILVSL